MRLKRSGAGFVVNVPAETAARLGLAEGDAVSLVRAQAEEPGQILPDSKREALATLDALAAVATIPPGYRFNRDEIYDDRMRELGW